jgi:F0F1-type ATP synthase assembly protein I
MIARIGVGLGGVAIGTVLGLTIRAFTHWTPAVIIVAILFGLLALVNDLREHPASDDRDRPTRLFPPDDDA